MMSWLALLAGLLAQPLYPDGFVRMCRAMARDLAWRWCCSAALRLAVYAATACVAIGAAAWATWWNG